MVAAAEKWPWSGASAHLHSADARGPVAAAGNLAAGMAPFNPAAQNFLPSTAPATSPHPPGQNPNPTRTRPQNLLPLPPLPNHQRTRLHRAKREFATIRKQQSRQQNGFESQKRQQEAHEAKTRLTNARAENAEIENLARSTMEVPLPGNIPIPFEDLTAAFRLRLQNLNKELATELTKKTAA